MFDLFREIGQSLRNNKLRTALTGFAVAWGIFMLVVLLGMSHGVVNAFNHNMGGQGNATIELHGGMTSKPYHGYSEGRRIQLKDDDVAEVSKDHSANVESATSMISNSAVISSSHDYITSGYSGVYPDTESEFGDLKVVSGRFINKNDFDERRKVVVLSRQNAGVLFPNCDSAELLNQRVTINGLSFKVVGMFDARWARSTFMPFTTAMMLKGDDGDIDGITVNVKNLSSEEDGERLEGELRETLGRIHDFDAADRSSLWVWNKFVQNLKMNMANDILNIAVWLIGIFTLLSGIVGVSNIMFVSVRERTHEIGIRRAIGARPRSILIQVITESVAITSLFGYFGILAGVGVSTLIGKIVGETDFLRNPTIDIKIAVYVILVLIVAGALAGLFPALKALKVKPVEALRTE